MTLLSRSSKLKSQLAEVVVAVAVVVGGDIDLLTIFDDDDDDAKEEEPAHHSDDIDSKSDSDDSGVEKEPSNEELESIESITPRTFKFESGSRGVLVWIKSQHRILSNIS